jgi:mRNA-degrading endonuclease RelE of RelBE toxin-antitoxin system
MSVPENEVIFDPHVARDIRRLPINVQQELSGLLELLRENPYHPLLHTKSLSAPLQRIFSFRIGRDYRGGFKFYASHTLLLLGVDKRDKIYGKLERRI